MKKGILVLMAALLASINQTEVRAETTEVSQNEVVDAEYFSTDSNDSGPSFTESDIQDNEVLTGDVEGDSESNNASDTDYGQLSDMVEMLRYDMVTYINFSYKMQICTVAILALIAGGNVAAVIINHFRS